MTSVTVGQESMSVPGSSCGKTCGAFFPRQAERTSGASSKRSSASSPPVLLFLDLTGGGQWDKSGCILGKDFSGGWRLFDAQYWGVPQRRERVALVADFAGVSAPEIVFDCDSGVLSLPAVRSVPDSLSGDSAPRGETGKGTSEEAADCIDTSGASICFMERGGCDGGGKGILIHEECAGTISSYQQRVLPPAICIQGNCIDRADTAGCNGKGWREDVCYTLNTIDRPAVYDARGNGNGEIVPTLTGDHENRVTDYTAVCIGNGQADQTKLHEVAGALNCMHDQQAVMCGDKVRRLTPLECERLQGFPDNWTLIGKPADLVIRTADYDPSVSWVEVIYKYIDDDGKAHRVTNSARYKALGNSIAIPSWYQLFKRLSAFCGDDRTLGSLFDGIGGFPFIWASLHGQDACLWASEIEPFAIAVTKQHFPERRSS